jgi:hypothetical protein
VRLFTKKDFIAICGEDYPASGRGYQIWIDKLCFVEFFQACNFTLIYNAL